jgi:hypothetical protein
MKRLVAAAVGLLTSLPLVAAVPGSAMAGQRPAAANACTSSTGVFNDVYIAYYNSFLYDPYGGGNGTLVGYAHGLENPTSTWDVVHHGSVSASAPFSDPIIDSDYQGCPIVELENVGAKEHYAVGDVDDGAVMRPITNGNYFVESPVNATAGEYVLINVHATNVNLGESCLTFGGDGRQAGYPGCNEGGQIIDFEGTA